MQTFKQIACIWGFTVLSSISAYSQEFSAPTQFAENNQQTAFNTPIQQPTLNTPKLLKHLDLSVNLGTTGIGFDLSAPIGDYVKVRAGFDYVPHFNYNMNFQVRVGDVNDEDYYNDALQQAKFDRLAKMLEQFTGYKVDNHVDVTGEPTFYNFKLLVDVFPFKQNKHWHFTAGFYSGPSKIAKAQNTIEEMPSLMAVAIYNHLYDKISAGEDIIFSVGDYDIPIFNDPELEDKILEFGRMGIYVGDKKADGTPYIMEPDENNLARTIIKVNSFKPYLGFGYGGRLLKNDDRYNISFDCGMLMWGGTPKILTHDGTNLAKEVENIQYKVGDYVDIIKTFKVYPILQVRLTYRLF